MSSIQPGRFITVEGIDGAGKSSHIEWLRAYLAAAGHSVVVTREPGGTPLGESLRAILLNDPMSPETEMMLMFAARAEHLASVIRPALETGAWVISDRFSDATYAYQVGGRGVPEQKFLALEALVQGGLQPDRTLLFDVSVETAQARLHDTRILDRFEREASDFHQRVREAYHQRAAQYPERIRRVASDVPMEQVRAQILTELSDLLG
ncbi:MAG: dTMP kinase [Fluviibacter sp.]|jgi:dTMP kinase|nr:dTMP kinase [Rhodocyclales bacterium]